MVGSRGCSEADPAGPLKWGTELSIEDIHVWRAGLDLETERLSALWQLLNAAERRRALRLRSPRRRNRFVACRGQLRLVLGSYLGRVPMRIGLTRGLYGKPRLAETAPDRGVVFNVSHSGDLALIAVGRERALGIDIQHWRQLKQPEAMARRCLAPIELEQWERLPEPQRLEAFYHCWAGKESFVKAVGRGISLGLNQVVMRLAGPPGFLSVPAEHGAARDWRLQVINLGSGMSAALSTGRGYRKVELASIPLGKL